MADTIDFNTMSDDAFDAYVASEGFQKIQRVAVMEEFLLRAAKRFHELDAELADAINADQVDQVFPVVKQEAWEFGRFNFSTQSDLRMFFSETDDFYEQTQEERKRLSDIADALTGSDRDPSKIEQAMKLLHGQKPWYVPDVFTQKDIDDLSDRISQLRDNSNLVNGYHAGTKELCNNLAKQNRALATELWENNAPPELKERYRKQFLGADKGRTRTSEELSHEKLMRSVLKGIQDTPLVLKGGTALMMAYGLDRFSEDLDFDAPVKLNLESKISKSMPPGMTLVALDRTKDTDTVSRYRLTYRCEEKRRSLKIEISYRNPPPDAEIRVIEGIRVASLWRIVDLKLMAAHDGEAPRSAVRDLYDLDFIARRYPAVFDESLSSRLLAYAADPVSLSSRYQADYAEDDLIPDLTDLDELALRLHYNATGIRQYQAEIGSRLSNIPKLRDTAGAAYTFWQIACAAIKEAGGREREVDWQAVELAVIEESIGSNGQSPESVRDALWKHSPSGVGQGQQAAIWNKIQVVAPQFQAQYEQSQTESPGNGMSLK